MNITSCRSAQDHTLGALKEIHEAKLDATRLDFQADEMALPYISNALFAAKTSLQGAWYALACLERSITGTS